MTPAVEAAKRAGISFRLHEYVGVDVGAGDYATAVAAALERPAAQLFKTLVASVEGNLALFIVPADRQLDLRAAGKRAQLAGKAEAERATGYVVGGSARLGRGSGCLRQSTPRCTSGRRFSSAQAAEGCRSSSRLPI